MSAEILPLRARTAVRDHENRHYVVLLLRDDVSLGELIRALSGSGIVLRNDATTDALVLRRGAAR